MASHFCLLKSFGNPIGGILFQLIFNPNQNIKICSRTLNWKSEWLWVFGSPNLRQFSHRALKNQIGEQRMKVLFWIYCGIYWATLHKFELGCPFCFCSFVDFLFPGSFIYSYATNYIVKVKKKMERKPNKNQHQRQQCVERCQQMSTPFAGKARELGKLEGVVVQGKTVVGNNKRNLQILHSMAP